MSELYNLVFIRVVDDQDPEQVRIKLSKTLKTEESRVQSWIDAKGPVTLLREIDHRTAEQVRNVALKCGAICVIEEVSLDPKTGLTLVPKKYRTTDIFICPASMRKRYR